MNEIPEFSVSGNNYDIGFQIGEKFKRNIQQTLATLDFTQMHKKTPELQDWIQDFKKHAQLEMPEFIQEIKGCAKGAEIDFEKLLSYNFLHAVDFELCSTILIKRKKEMVLGHNEDYTKELGQHSYLLNVKLLDGIQFYSFTYPGTLPGSAFAVNSHGLVFSANSLPTPIMKSAFPRIFLDRKILELKSIDEIISLLHQYSERSAPLNYNILSLLEHRAVNIETTWNDFAVSDIEHQYFHTNHFISEKFAHISTSRSSKSNTHNRLRIAKNYLNKTNKQETKAKEILFHPEIHESTDPSPTICTAIFRVKQKQIVLRIFGESEHKPLFERRFPEFFQKSL